MVYVCRLHVRSGVEGAANDGGDPEDRLPINKWTHVAVSHTAGNFKVYIQGELRLTRTDVKAPLLNDGPLWACFRTSTPADAELTDVRVYPKVLSVDDVKAVQQEKAYEQFAGKEQ